MVSVGLVLPPLVCGGRSCRDQAHTRLISVQFLKGVDHHQQAAVYGLPEGDPAFFLLAVVLIVNRQGQRIVEHGRGRFELDAVLAAVAGGFVGILGEAVDERGGHPQPLTRWV